MAAWSAAARTPCTSVPSPTMMREAWNHGASRAPNHAATACRFWALARARLGSNSTPMAGRSRMAAKAASWTPLPHATSSTAPTGKRSGLSNAARSAETCHGVAKGFAASPCTKDKPSGAVGSRTTASDGSGSSSAGTRTTCDMESPCDVRADQEALERNACGCKGLGAAFLTVENGNDAHDLTLGFVPQALHGFHR